MDVTASLGPMLEEKGPATPPEAKALKGRHVALTRLEDNHLKPLWSTVGCHKELFVHWPDGPYASQSQFTNSLKRDIMTESTLTAYAVSLPDGKPVGLGFLQPADLQSRVIETGALFGPALQRTRAATEAIFLLSYAFDQLNNRRVEWKTTSTNKASISAAERYGLAYEGCLRQHRIQKQRNRDTLWFSMIDGEWPLCKRAFEAWLHDDNFDQRGEQKRDLRQIRESLAQDLD